MARLSRWSFVTAGLLAFGAGAFWHVSSGGPLGDGGTHAASAASARAPAGDVSSGPHAGLEAATEDALVEEERLELPAVDAAARGG